jgi:CO/xanthine dehydrogenase FAD-binding subunit
MSEYSGGTNYLSSRQVFSHLQRLDPILQSQVKVDIRNEGTIAGNLKGGDTEGLPVALIRPSGPYAQTVRATVERHASDMALELFVDGCPC